MCRHKPLPGRWSGGLRGSPALVPGAASLLSLWRRKLLSAPWAGCTASPGARCSRACERPSQHSRVGVGFKLCLDRSLLLWLWFTVERCRIRGGMIAQPRMAQASIHEWMLAALLGGKDLRGLARSDAVFNCWRPHDIAVPLQDGLGACNQFMMDSLQCHWAILPSTKHVRAPGSSGEQFSEFGSRFRPDQRGLGCNCSLLPATVSECCRARPGQR